MLNIVSVNEPSDRVSEITLMKEEFRQQMNRTVNSGDVVIVADFPPVCESLGILHYLIGFNLNRNKPKNYFRFNGKYIDNFFLIVNVIDFDDIISIDDDILKSESGSEFNLSLFNEKIRWEFYDFFFDHDPFLPFSISLIKNDSINFSGNNRYAIRDLKVESLLSCIKSQFALRPNYDQHVQSFNHNLFNSDSFYEKINRLIEMSNVCLKPGVLTKKKMSLISRNTKITNEIFNNTGKRLQVVEGKAGTGKTVQLLKVVHRLREDKKRVRFLTYNNLLVNDIKLQLKNSKKYSYSAVSIQTIHQFMYRLTKVLGLQLLFSSERVDDLLSKCENRVIKLEEFYNEVRDKRLSFKNRKNLVNLVIDRYKKGGGVVDEAYSFANYLSFETVFNEFSSHKENYLSRKRKILQDSIGHKVFIEDYHKILQELYNAIDNPKKVYENLEIREKFDLLSALYDTDGFLRDNDSDSYDEDTIPFENFNAQISRIRRQTNWSKSIFVDEGQDCLDIEKEIIIKLIGAENLIVATGGKDQLIRSKALQNWRVSQHKDLPFNLHNLYNTSHRQKSNIIDFVNKFANSSSIDLKISPSKETKDRGSVVIDTRPKDGIIKNDVLVELVSKGKIMDCSDYESCVLLIPSNDSYSVNKSFEKSFEVNEDDFFYETELAKEKDVLGENFLPENIILWKGISADKSQLPVPKQNETRLIFYESCRGLESWSVACLSIDSFFNLKRSTSSAGRHLESDMFYTEDQRRDIYASIWCLMAFTRPMDTLYIHIDDIEDPFSKKLISIAKECKGVTFYE